MNDPRFPRDHLSALNDDAEYWLTSRVAAALIVVLVLAIAATAILAKCESCGGAI